MTGVCNIAFDREMGRLGRTVSLSQYEREGVMRGEVLLHRLPFLGGEGVAVPGGDGQSWVSKKAQGVVVDVGVMATVA
jgi:hypothetical protein